MMHLCRIWLRGGDGRERLLKSIRLLERVRELQNAPVVVMAPYDLKANWQAFRGESGRDGDRRQDRHRNEVAGAHPIDVAAHLYSVDLLDVLLIDVESGYLRDGEDEKVVLHHH